MNHPHGVPPHSADPERRPRSRHRRAGLVGGIAGFALVLGAATAAPGGGVVADDPPEPPTKVELSMEVRPGQPVPMALVRRAGEHAFDRRGHIGQGVDVAIIDSGVSAVPGLDAAGKLLHGPDLSDEGADPALVTQDSYGHGTHLAGIIAGDDVRVQGIAPGSRLVSLKVAGGDGYADVLRVVAAIDWVVEHRNRDGLNIRVLNLALGLPDVDTHVGDPLSAAVERAWDAGIVVVAAAGNRGWLSGGIDSPALSPDVIAVGAIARYESYGSMDSIALWTSAGNASRQPDLTAPGQSIVSFRVPGSTLDEKYPFGRVGDRYFRGSGTSQATAVVSGYAANLLSMDASLTPDQVKYLLMQYADDMDPGYLDGEGKIDPRQSARFASKASGAPVQNNTPAVSGGPGIDTPTWSGGEWHGASWSGASWSGASWSGASWSGASWSGASWSGASWSGASWSGASWAGASWSGVSWSGEVAE